MIPQKELRDSVELMVAAVIQDYKDEGVASSDFGDMLVASAFVRHVIEAHAGATSLNRGDIWLGASHFVGENTGIFHEAAGRRYPRSYRYKMADYIADNWREVFPQAEHVIVGIYCSELVAAIEGRPRRMNPAGLAAVARGMTGDGDVEPIPLPPPEPVPEALLRAWADQGCPGTGKGL